MNTYLNNFIKTSREDPSGEVSVNAKLLDRAGFIDKLMAGSYSLLPLGRLVERKIEQIIREEMLKTGASEVLLPLLHPKEIWNETGRWDSAKEVMYQFKNGEKEYALSFTHEEIVMDLIRKHTTSYKDFPVKIFQFSTKFRNELRAKSGILRGREFLMKDLYSAHTSEEDLMGYYWKMVDAYIETYQRMGLEVLVTEASGGVFTDKGTHEFQLICDAGEDVVYKAPDWKFAKNKEVMSDEDLKRPDLKEFKTIEVGNIFPLGTYYSEKMDANFVDTDGQSKPIWFGSYGIGVTRLMGSIVEKFHDKKGIIWPWSVAPYQVVLLDLTSNQNAEIVKDIVGNLEKKNVEVLVDDRNCSAGQKLADADLIGIPYRVVLSKKSVELGGVSVKKRSAVDEKIVPLDELVDYLKPF